MRGTTKNASKNQILIDHVTQKFKGNYFFGNANKILYKLDNEQAFENILKFTDNPIQIVMVFSSTNIFDLHDWNYMSFI